MDIKENIKLAEFTTFGIGGNAKFFCAVRNLAEAQEAIAFASEKELPIFILGGGSNVLISNQGFEGLVIKNEIKTLKVQDNYLTAGAGENWQDVVAKAIELKLQGIECLSGIPGTFGGAVVQNIGAYGQTLSDSVESVEAIDLSDGKIKVFSKEDCEFEYRNSLFKKNPGTYFVLAAVLKLTQIDRGSMTYPSVKMKLGAKPFATLKEVSQAVIEIRASKGMVILPNYEKFKSAGSYFKNPIISYEQFYKIKPTVQCPGEWFWLLSDRVKVAAACLVESAGFKKGTILDAAQISPKQPLAIINPGFAAARDIMSLASKIKKGVRDKFGVALEEEIVYVGKF